MNSASINPIKGPDIQPSKAPASPEKTVSAPPVDKVEVAPKDTVTLSPAAKNAGQKDAPVATQDDVSQSSSDNNPRPTNQNDDVAGDSSRKFSVTEANDVVLKIVDNKTQEVVKQIPSEEELQLKTAIRDGVENISSENKSPEELI